ncbi:MAG: EamA family transporter [Candidatus Sulfotelmatobacter sp.]|jgi:drug/metabolite transporter (DMT)-like permease
MVLNRSAQIMALLRSGKMINIGGRPVIVTNPRKSASTHDRGLAIKLALAFVAIYVIWGSTYLAIRYAVETIPPLVTVGVRQAVAGAIMLAWACARGFRPTRQQWAAGFVLGTFFFLIGHGSLFWAEQYVGSGLAALLIATEPMFILVLAWMMGQQRISRLSAVGLGVGVVGVAMLTGAELTVKGSSLLGLLAVLLGSLSWSLGVVISPRLKLPSDALGRTALPTICGAVMLLAAAGISGEFQQTHWASISMRSLFGLGYLITFGSVVAFTAYTWLLQRVPPTLVATHTYANPIVAVLLGWFLAHEPLTMRVVLASVAILGAIVLIRRGERTVSVKAPEAVPAAAEIKASQECA